jgi:hypothetical protein
MIGSGAQGVVGVEYGVPIRGLTLRQPRWGELSARTVPFKTEQRAIDMANAAD